MEKELAKKLQEIHDLALRIAGLTPVGIKLDDETEEIIPKKQLSKRQQQLFDYIVENPNIKIPELAKKFDVAEKTIETHLDKIRLKYGFTERSEIIQLAQQQHKKRPK